MYAILTHSTRYIILFLLLLCSTQRSSAQNEASDFKIDSLVYNYYQKCRKNIKSPIVLSMSDTLFQMAGAKGDQRMQAVALSTQLDYYYYQGTHEDSILIYVNRVKEFAKHTNQPKFYYSVWGNRLIHYYIKQGKTNMALFESRKMLNEAKQEDYKSGIATCYNCLSSIYEAKNIKEKSLYYKLKEAELNEKYQLENYNIAILYASIASQYLNQGKPEKALPLLKKAETVMHGESQRIVVKLRYVHYYLVTGMTATSFKYLQECQLAFNKDPRLAIMIKYLYEMERLYYTTTKQYARALASIAKHQQELRETKENTAYSALLRVKADIYWEMNRKAEAADCYREYLAVDNTLRVEYEETTAGEFATLLNVQQLNDEKSEMQSLAQEKQLQDTRIMIILLGALLSIAVAFSYREKHLNKKLKYSQEELVRKNNSLLQSQKELSQAKEIAEQASRMKTSFIQNVSHEIRTPLNAIVGFSQVLTNYFADNEEAKEFSSIIETNSNLLLKLITDVLILADLDQMEESVNTITTDINLCCQESIDLTKPHLREGVALQFECPEQELIVKTNPKHLSQVLTNLLNNAAKFTTQGDISLAYVLSKKDGTLQFIVTDTGIGIPESEQQRVFERFIKLDSFSQGTGLGLPISRLIADRLDGTLSIDQNYKAGCRFLLSIPYVPA